MKKITLLLIGLLATVCSVMAQTNVEIGIRLSPVFVFNRVSGSTNISETTYDFSKDGSKIGFLFGPTFDIPFKSDQYYIGTGIFLLSKPVRLKGVNSGGQGAGINNQAYNTQYVQIPATFKLFTDEIIPSGSLYFQLGGTLDIQVSRKAKDDYAPEFFSKATPLDIGLLFSSGMEYSIGNNTLFFGLSYIRGLIDAAADVDGLSIKNDMLTIDLGIKF